MEYRHWSGRPHLEGKVLGFTRCRNRDASHRGRLPVLRGLIRELHFAACILAIASLSAVSLASAQVTQNPALADISQASPADIDDFNRYVASLWPKAHARGVSRTTFSHAFANVTPDLRILAKPNQQPELERPIWDYLRQIVSDKRFNMGRQALADNSKGLRSIEQAYGVPPNIVVAVWGVESMYGTNTGQYNVIRSLATLGWRGGHRARFGEQQLLSALRIVEHGDVAPEQMTGSWAGAMGHTQFIPTTYEAYAVDFDGDGRRDIWGSATDAVASAAHLLKANGWHAGEPWGYEVRLPPRFDFAQAGLSNRKPIGAWAIAGLKHADGRPLEQADWKGSLLLPAGANGPALLVFGNFRALLRYNNSVSYGMAVAWLAQKLVDAPFLTKPWPEEERALQTDERRELQRLLSARGFPLRSQDGVLGSETISALRTYQQSKGLPADGFPSLRLLQELRKDARS